MLPTLKRVPRFWFLFTDPFILPISSSLGLTKITILCCGRQNGETEGYFGIVGYMVVNTSEVQIIAVGPIVMMRARGRRRLSSLHS